MDYIQTLKAAAIKVTPHKITILELFTNHRHLDATQIVDILKANGIEISIATVYRILASFEAKGIISKHNFSNEQATYELNQGSDHHDHLICNQCGRVIEFSNSQIEELQLQIAAQNQFIIESHTLNIYGRCAYCQQLRKSPA